MLENQKEILQAENDKRKAEELKRKNSLKVHKLSVENKISLERKYINILGFNLEDDVQAWQVDAQRQIGPKNFGKHQIMMMESVIDQIHYIPPRVREFLAYDFIKQLSADKKKKLVKDLQEELKNSK